MSSVGRIGHKSLRVANDISQTAASDLAASMTVIALGTLSVFSLVTSFLMFFCKIPLHAVGRKESLGKGREAHT